MSRQNNGRPLAGNALLARLAVERELQMIFGTTPSVGDLTNSELTRLTGSGQARKDAVREKLASDVDDFLASGGTVEQVPEGTQTFNFGANDGSAQSVRPSAGRAYPRFRNVSDGIHYS